MMHRFLFAFMIVLILGGGSNAAVFDVESALRATYNNCVGIEDSLHDMKTQAGINTVVMGVGTGIGIGAVAVGVAKAKTDSLIEEKFKILENLSYAASSGVETMDGEQWLEIFQQSDENYSDNELRRGEETEEMRRLTEKSKKLGNWRTGLLVGNTATNIAGTVMAGANKVDATLSEQIQNCRLAVQNLSKAIAHAQIEGIDVAEAVEIKSACDGFEYVDVVSIEKINNRAKGGMISSAVGAGTGVVGVITSALANSDRVRKDDTVSGKQKEKSLNAAANVFAVGSTIASGAATAFNAAQVKAIKDVVSVAEKCSGALR